MILQKKAKIRYTPGVDTTYLCTRISRARSSTQVGAYLKHQGNFWTRHL